MSDQSSSRMQAVVLSAALLLGAVVNGCTWVKTTPAGGEVRVVPRDRVADCKRVGELSTYTKAEVAGVERKASKVRQELETLARNEAAEMGADTIVAVSNVVDGRRKFIAYKCL